MLLYPEKKFQIKKKYFVIIYLINIIVFNYNLRVSIFYI